MITHEALVTLSYEIAVEIAKVYKVEVNEVQQKLLQLWAKNLKLAAVLQSSSTLKDLQRTRVFKDSVKSARREIYQGLRKFKQSADALFKLDDLGSGDEQLVESSRQAIVQAHVSTRERGDSINATMQRLAAWQPNLASVLDVGCGVMPLQFPFHLFADSLKDYVAIDKDATSIAAIKAFAATVIACKLQAQHWRLEQGWENIPLPRDSKDFDIAFMFKLVPLVARQEMELLDLLARVPAKCLVISGSRVSMTKHQDISKRENRALQSFFDKHALSVVEHFDTEDEIIYFLERSH